MYVYLLLAVSHYCRRNEVQNLLETSERVASGRTQISFRLEERTQTGAPMAEWSNAWAPYTCNMGVQVLLETSESIASDQILQLNLGVCYNRDRAVYRAEWSRSCTPNACCMEVQILLVKALPVFKYSNSILEYAIRPGGLRYAHLMLASCLEISLTCVVWTCNTFESNFVINC